MINVTEPMKINIELLTTDPYGPKRITINNGHDTIGYKMRRCDINKDMAEEFFKELHTAGVYILLGDRKMGIGKEIYVGQSDNIANRLYQHRGKREGEKKTGKAFWDECMAFVTESRLEVSHAKYLEDTLYDIIAGFGRFAFNNEDDPKPNLESIKESTKQEGDKVIEDAKTICACLTIPIFEPVEPDEEFEGINALFIRRENKDGSIGISAKGHEHHTADYPNGFMVHAGSIITEETTKKATHSIKDMRKKLEKYNVIGKRDGRMVFLNNRIFESPGIAASVVFGRSASANEWIDGK